NVATVNPGAGSQNAGLTSMPKAAETSLEPKSSPVRVAQLSLLPTGDVMKVHGLTAGSILPTAEETAPLFTPVIDSTSGTCLISISSLNGKVGFRGSGPLLFIDIEAIGEGNASLVFVKETLHLVATDARDITSEIVQGTATVKQQ